MAEQRTKPEVVRMKPIVATDYRGRRAVLLSRIGRIQNGCRYVTRASLRRVILGEAAHTRPRMLGTQAPNGWPSSFTSTERFVRVKIGCHRWYGDEARKLVAWALA